MHTNRIPAVMLCASFMTLSPSTFAGTFSTTFNDFSFEATGPMGLGRVDGVIVPVDDINKGYQLVESKIQIVASTTTASTVDIIYNVSSELVDGVITNTVDASGTAIFHYDVIITDVDPNYDFYGKADGESYTFTGVTSTASLQYVSTGGTTAQFVLDTTGTDITTDPLNGTSLALGIDVNGVDENLVALDPATAPVEYLDVIKFKSNEFLSALTNINLSLIGGTISYDPTPALLSGGVQDEYLDPEFSLLMQPTESTTTDSGNSGSVLDGTATETFGGWYSIYGGTVTTDPFSLSGESIFVSDRTSLNSGIAYDGLDVLLSNEAYTFEADVYITGSSNATFYPKLKSRTGARNTFTTIGKEILTPNQWHHVVMEFTTPDISQASNVEVIVNGMLSTADFYIDNINLSGQSATVDTTPEVIDPNGYLINDDFEDATRQSWMSSGGVITVEATGSQSSSSILNSARGSSMHGLYKNILGKLDSNTTYIMDADVFVDGALTSNVIAEVKSRVGAKNTFTRVGKQAIQPGAWTHITMEFTTPDITDASLLELKFYGPQGAYNFGLDNIQLRAQ